MTVLIGYRLFDKIYENNKIFVYRGTREEDNRPVIVKFLQDEFPAIQDLKQLDHEFKIGNALSDIPGVIKHYSLEKINHSKALVLEDFDGVPLSDYINAAKPGLKEILQIAIGIVNILKDIHFKNVIHKDINPSNIIINLETKEIKIIDFGIAAEVQRETTAAMDPDRKEGTLYYISPEQTGRMNRSVDFRSDFYSLGATLYELLTGKVPFENELSMELIYSHIALEPVSCHTLNADIPPVVSGIIMKLLAKNAEERYQGSHGLISDLELCYKQLKDTGKIEPFEIGEKDISEIFLIPEKLYGREIEISILIDLFKKASKGKKEIIYFSGPSGIGKSALIHEIEKSMIEKQGYFISGKYDLLKKSIPYTAIIQAFRELSNQLLMESETKIDKWKETILEAVGNNGQVIIDVIPEIEFIIGKQGDVEQLPPVEAQNRFNLVFQDFIKVFASKEHPLVLFIDDFQWADNASLLLIDILLSDPELEYMLFIGAYRNNEVDSGHPFVTMQDKMKKKGLFWTDITLTPLTKKNIGEMLVDSLHCSMEKTAEFSRLIEIKTAGNPFFVIEFLKTLYHDDLIMFEQGWKWDITKIEQAGITDNVITLMANKINILPANTLNIITVASCIGAKIKQDTLSLVLDKNGEEIFKDLKEAINQGMIIKVEEDLNFAHDKVQEAAYSLIETKKQAELHHTIGNIFLHNAKVHNTVDESIFVIANQLNLAKKLLSGKEKQELIELNSIAGKKAKVSAAYEAAIDFFKQGSELLPENSWEIEYDRTLSFYIEWSEAEYVATRFEEAEQLFAVILENAKTLLDKVKVYTLQISHYTSQMKHQQALEVGRKALKQLGNNLPEEPDERAALPDIKEAKKILGDRKIEDLINQPTVTNSTVVATIHILQSCVVSAYLSNPNLFLVVVVKMIIATLKYGDYPGASVSYSVYAIILAGALGEIINGYEYARLALKVADKYGLKLMQGKSLFHFCWFNHWKRPLKENLDLFMRSYQYCLEAGDLLYASYSLLHYSFTHFNTGDNLNIVREINDKYTPLLDKLKQPASNLYVNSWKQAVLNLLGESEDKNLIQGEFYDENKSVPELQEANDNTGLAFYYIPKIILCYINEEYQTAFEAAQHEEIILGGVFGMLLIQVFHFYHALTLAALYPEANTSDRKKYLEKLKNIHKDYKKWSEIGTYNYEHKYFLISAELARVTGDDKTAMKLYDSAIKGASKNGFIQEEAIANECAAKFYKSLKMDTFANIYISEAYYCYKTWGANQKIKDLEKKYSRMLPDDPNIILVVDEG
ncbi:MAG: serine/threonine-protein kinase PknK [bacterium]|nr:serine/threonine-protein kinase PknK [bacterium]